MPIWKPEAKWAGQDAFIIGGGNSLRARHFDWNLLKPELTIGCNTAFTLGPEICKICFFGDKRWWEGKDGFCPKDELTGFKGAVFTNVHSLFRTRIPWLWTMPRESVGLHTDALGWNGNTGASALNLALILGAKRVFLLGFDMKHVSGKSNWHDHIVSQEAVRPGVYVGFCKDFKYVVQDWKTKFADREIINVTDDSALDCFPKVPFDSFWTNRIMKRAG